MRKGLAVLAAALTLFMGSVAHAQPSIDFGINADGLGGQISFAGGNAPLVGSNLRVTNVFGVGTSPSTNLPVTDGALGNGRLDFSTGPGSGTALTWSGGGVITITGAVPDAGIAAPTVLTSGTFTSAQIIPGGVGGPPTRVLIGFVLSNLDPTLAAFYNLPTNLPYEGTLFVGLQPGPISKYGGAFTSANVVEGSLVLTPLPEPSSMILLGVGAVGALVGYRRRLKVAA